MLLFNTRRSGSINIEFMILLESYTPMLFIKMFHVNIVDIFIFFKVISYILAEQSMFVSGVQAIDKLFSKL